MTDGPFGRLRRFLAELKRRKVYRVAVVYAAVAFVVWQAAEIAFPALRLPEWALTLVVVFSLLGFPIAVVLAWAFDVTPEGVRRTEAAGDDAPGSRTGTGGWVVALLALVLAGGVAWWAMGRAGSGPSADARTAADTTIVQTAGTPDTAGPPRIAVLPFENIAPDSSDAFFAEGMHEEVLNQLSKVAGLEVISRTSVMQYAGTDKTVQEIREELGGVQALLEGTVRRAGDQVRITTQLIDARRDTHLWSNTYDRELSVDQIFRIQSDIASRIAEAMETTLTAGERRRIEDAPTSNLAAYDAYLQGRNHWWRIWATYDLAHVDRSVERLRTAIRIDSAFAEAHAWLGLAYGARSRFSGESRWLDSASVAAARARSLAPNSSTVRSARGHLLFWADSLDAAEEALREALEHQPSSSFATSTLAIVLGWKGDWVEEIRWAHRTVQLDPRRAEFATYIGSTLQQIGWFEPAEAWYRRARELNPDFLRTYMELVNLRERQGRYADARRIADEFLRDHPTHPEMYANAADVALHAGDPERARRNLERVRELMRSTYFPEGSPTRPDRIRLPTLSRMDLGLAELRLGNRERGRELLSEGVDSLRARVARTGGVGTWPQVLVAGGLAALGQKQEALHELEKCVDAGFPNAAWVRTLPYFDSLRSDPGFEELVRGVEGNQARVQDEVRRLDIDLYPPGVEPDTVTAPRQSDG